jgi:hypothetical protein
MPGSTASVSFSTGNIDQNTNTGLYIRSNGAISVTSLNARWNGFMLGTGYGADLNNALGANKAITVTKSLFQENDNGGISALSNGAITLNAVQLIQNNGRGANLLNTLGTGKVDILSSMGKTKIYENTNTGLRILSAGTVTISGIEVYQNIGIGIGIDNSTGVGNVTFSGCTVFDNDNIGADVASSGVININNSKLDHNAAYGARIINTADTSGTKGVTVKNSTFSGNTGGYGLRIESHGTVLMTTVKAENNNGEGAWINNLAGTTTGTSIVTISGINSFSNNNNDGLVVYGKGAVTLAGITALNNNGVGMFLNTDTGSTINISNATLKQNNENGIYALSGGAINISGMVVLFNGTTANYSGAYLSATGYDLTIKNSAFNANGASGIVAYTGATHTLYLTGVNYFGNDYFGGLVDPDLSFDGHLVLN